MRFECRRLSSFAAAAFGVALLASSPALAQVCEEPLIPPPEPEKPATSMIGGFGPESALQP